jgi:hypothetical protein
LCPLFANGISIVKYENRHLPPSLRHDHSPSQQTHFPICTDGISMPPGNHIELPRRIPMAANDDIDEAKLAQVLAEVPKGSVVVAVSAIAIVIAIWFVFYFFAFLPRGPIG